MIIAELFGGLGNQMFQYATARRLAYVHRTKLKLDVSAFNSQTLRKYALNCFDIQEAFASQDEINKYKPWKMKLSKRIIAKIKKIASPQPYFFVKERFHQFDSEILNLPNNVYLSGYWQSEKYFEDIKTIILKDFQIKIPQTCKNKTLSKIIESCNSVSIHIRRSDYVTNPKVSKFMDVCGIDYYHFCIHQITRNLNKPNFFVFSDDPEWVKGKLKTKSPMVIIDCNGTENVFEDLRLISQCKHNIIANSSFSWWGAWINKNPNKIVIAPKIWSKNLKMNCKDVVPKDWSIL